MFRSQPVGRSFLLRVIVGGVLTAGAFALVFSSPGSSRAEGGGGGGACTPLASMAAPFVGPNAELGFYPTRPLDDNANVKDAEGSGQMFERVNAPGITNVASLNSTTGLPDNSPTGTEKKGIGGSVMADLNSDGLTDIVLQYDKLGSGATQNAFNPNMTRFMLNDGCGHFTETPHTFGGEGVNAIPANVNKAAEGNTAVPYFADFNGDGWPDIYITRNKSSNSFYINNGDTNKNGKVDDFNYTNYANSMGLSNFGAYNRQAQIGDVNGDGFLDIAVGADQIANRPAIGRPSNRMFVYQPPAGGVKTPSDFVNGKFVDLSGPTSDGGVTTQTATSPPSAQGYERPINLNPTTGLVPGFGGSKDAANTNSAVAESNPLGGPPISGNPAFSPAPNPVFSATNPGYCNTKVDKAGPRLVMRDLDGNGTLDLIQSYHADMNTRIPPTAAGQTQQTIIDSTCSPSNWGIGIFAWQNLIPTTGKFVQRTEADGNGLVDEGRLKYVGGKGTTVGSAITPTSPLTAAAIAGRAGTTPDSTGHTAPTGTWEADPAAGDAPSLAYLNTADVNNDGKLDVIAVGDSSTISHAQSGPENVDGRFWMNDGGFKFHNATSSAGLDSLNWSYDQWAAFFGNETFPESARIIQGACKSSNMQGPNPGTCWDDPAKGGTGKGAAEVAGDIKAKTGFGEAKIYGADTTFADFNNDGYIDFLLSDRREIDGAWGQIRDVLYMNDGNGHFTPQKTTISGVDSSSIAAEVGDVNNDGLPDILMNADPLNTYTVQSALPAGDILRGVDPPEDRFKDKLYINQGLAGAASNNYVKVLLTGGLDRELIGSQIYLYNHSDSTLLGRRDVFPTDSYKSSHGLDVEFGLGNHTAVDAVVKLPNGGTRTFTNIPLNDLDKLNVTTAAVTTTFDKTAPTIRLTAPADGASFKEGSSHLASYSCDDTGGSRLNTCAGPVASGDPVDTSTAGEKTFTVHAVDFAGNVTDQTVHYTVVAKDKTPPVISCGAADGAWHATNVSIPCTASDAESGLNEPADASFALVTSVPDGTADASAATGSHKVCDVEGNCADAGPIPGNKIDRKVPTISVSCPGTASVGSVADATVAASDEDSGLASDPSGTVSIDTSTAGTKTVTRTAVDNVGNEASDSCSTQVEYPTPGAPALTSGATPNPNGLFTLAWSGTDPTLNPGISYTLQHRNAAAGEWSEVATGLVALSYSFEGAGEAEGTWIYRVRGTDTMLGQTTDWSASSGPIVVDESAPAAPTVSPDRAPDYAGGGGWYKDTVGVSFTDNGDPALVDGSPGSGVDPASIPATQTFATDGPHTASGTVSDLVGNQSATGSAAVQVDASAPNLQLSCPAPVPIGTAGVKATVTATDGQSGLASDPSGTVAINTSTAGTKTVTRTAVDNVGHQTTGSCSTLVGYTQVITGNVGKLVIKSGQAVKLTSTAKVSGTVTVQPGGALDVEGATISGALNANGATLLRICGANIAGTTKAVKGTGSVVMGEGNEECPSSTVHGTTTVKENKAGVLINKNAFLSSLKVLKNEGGANVINNTVAGELVVTGNTGTVVDKPNTVEGKSKLQ